MWEQNAYEEGCSFMLTISLQSLELFLGTLISLNIPHFIQIAESKKKREIRRKGKNRNSSEFVKGIFEVEYRYKK